MSEPASAPTAVAVLEHIVRSIVDQPDDPVAFGRAHFQFTLEERARPGVRIRRLFNTGDSVEVVAGELADGQSRDLGSHDESPPGRVLMLMAASGSRR